MKKRIIIAGVLCLLFAILVGTWLAGNFLCASANQSVGNLPSDLVGRSVEFYSESGATIRGWLIPGQRGVGAIVLMHGVRANRLSMLDRARFLSRAGYTVLLFDFQAHGESAGKRITFGYLESQDARAAVEFFRQSAPGERIGIIGLSMGGASALLASPPLNSDVMVLEMVYPTIKQAINNRLVATLGSWSSILTPLLSWQFRPRLGIGADSLRPIDRVGSLRAPKLFIAGEDDRYTTLEESRQMFEAASEPKTLWVVNGAGHQDIYPLVKAEYERRILEFFGRYLKQEPVVMKPRAAVP